MELLLIISLLTALALMIGQGVGGIFFINIHISYAIGLILLNIPYIFCLIRFFVFLNKPKKRESSYTLPMIITGIICNSTVSCYTLTLFFGISSCMLRIDILTFILGAFVFPLWIILLGLGLMACLAFDLIFFQITILDINGFFKVVLAVLLSIAIIFVCLFLRHNLLTGETEYVMNALNSQ